jgi:hypothetical protein
MVNNQPIKPFIRPQGHECHVSTGIHGLLTFGIGELDEHGFWENSCYECAREHEKQFPECGFCWPHTLVQLEKMGFKDESVPTDAE